MPNESKDLAFAVRVTAVSEFLYGVDGFTQRFLPVMVANNEERVKAARRTTAVVENFR
jgi:hypothetical protein